MSSKILTDVILPCATWKAGKQMVKVRGLAIKCWLLLTDEYIPKSIYFNRNETDIDGDFSIFRTKFITLIGNCMDDDDINSRVNTLKLCIKFFSSRIFHTISQFKYIYPEILKRLDDSIDSVRILSCESLVSLIDCMEYFHSNFKESGDGVYIESALDNVHFETIIKTVTVHMDDMNVEVQEAACRVLEKMSTVQFFDVSLVKVHLESVSARHRSTMFTGRVLRLF